MKEQKTTAVALQAPVSVSWVSNILDPVATRQQMALAPGCTLGAALAKFVPLAPPGFEVTACLNGDLLPVARHDIILLPGDNLVMTARPQDSGGGGSNPLQMIAMIAVIVVAAVATWYVGGAGGWAVGAGYSAGTAAAMGAAVGGVVVMGGGYLVSQAFKVKSPDYGGGQDALGSSPSYSWQAQGNPLAEGATLPVLYGRFLVTPPLIARNIDSVGSEQHLNLLYAIAGHKIDAVEEVLINDQSYSTYRNTVLDVRLGDADQTPIPFFGDLKEEVAIAAKLTTQWTQRELPGSMQGFAVGIGYRLYYANDKGGMDYRTAKIYIEYRRKGAAAWTRVMTTALDPMIGVWRQFGLNLPDKTVTYDFLPLHGNDPNQLHYVAYVDNVPAGEYELRMCLVEPLEEGARNGSDVWWEFAQLIQYDDFTYPGTALGGLRALSTDQISGGQPVVKFLVRRDYVWVYDANAGRYVQKSARNPAWASWDALHNGALDHPDSSAYGLAVAHNKIVYADFLDWATWCDKKGYTVDLYVESPVGGKNILDMLGLMGRGSVVQIGSRYTCMVDKPRDLPRQTFLVGLGNIASQTYIKDWLPMQDRANVVELTYFDATANYQRQTVEIYQDGFDTSSRVVIKTQRTLYGCSSRKAALTFGRGLMLRNRYLTFMPSFETGVESIHCLPGDPIDLAVDTLQGGASGRVVTADEHSITLDCAVPMVPGVQYALELQHIETDDREYAYIVGVSQNTEAYTLTLLKPLEKIPAADTKYAFGQVGRTKKMFTIVDMKTASDQRKRLQLLEYIPEVYDDDVYDVPDTSIGDTAAAFIRNLKITEIWLPGGADGSGKPVIGLTWQGNALYWNVWLREASSGKGWSKADKVSTASCLIETGVTVGKTYDLSVSIGAPEAGAQGSITLRGKLAPPADVQSFRAVAHADAVYLTWDHIPDADLWQYQIRVGKSWDTGMMVLDGVTENSATWAPPMDGTYRLWIKALDLYGIYSVNAVDALVTIDISTSINIVWQREELPQGVVGATLDHLLAMDGGKALSWVPSLTDTDPPPWYTDKDLADYCGGTFPGVYTSQIYDLGVVTPFTLRLHADFSAVMQDATDRTYPDRTDLTYPADTDQHLTSLSVYQVSYRVSDDAQGWSDWAVFITATDLTARYMQFRFSTVLDAVGVKFSFTRMAAIADVSEQEKTFKASIVKEGTRFTFAGLGLRPMLMEYHVGVTMLGAAALYPVVEEEAQAFTVRCFDVLGNQHAANTSIEIRGF